MRKAYQRSTGRRIRTGVTQSPPPLQLTLDRREVLCQLQEGLHAFGVMLGVEVAKLFMNEEVERLCGARYEHRTDREATRHGWQAGVITIGGQKLPVRRPRVRSTKGRGEVPLSVYGLAQRGEAMPEAVLRRAVRGVSCRDYEGVIEKAAEGFGVRRSSVSRGFLRSSSQKIAELSARRFERTRFAVIFIDGVGFADTTMIVALGIAEDGSKRVLGFREGPTENALVCKALLEELIERGIDPNLPALFVIDGSKALRKAIGELWGPQAFVHRCRIHKKRNIEAHVQLRYWPDVERMLERAWRESQPSRALKQLQALASYLDRISPDAAASLREGMEETLTVTRLGIPAPLAVHLITTNPIESAFSMTRKITARVKRWRGGAMKHRWCATGLLEAEKGFRCIKAFEYMPQLLRALDDSQAHLNDRQRLA